MTGEVITLPQLRGLIGLRVRHLGRAWVIVEVLDAPPGLVLESHGQGTTMHRDVHGRPWEYAAQTVLIPVLSSDQAGLSDELLALDLLDDD